MPPSPQIHHFVEAYFFRVSFSPPREETHLPNDLEGLRVNGVTVPPDLALTAQKPDLVIIKKGTKEVFLVEIQRVTEIKLGPLVRPQESWSMPLGDKELPSN